MKKRFLFWCVTAALGAFVGIVFARERRQTLELQGTVAAARISVADAAKLRGDNQRLRERQIPADELARWRADHAALPRLRAELRALSSEAGITEPPVAR